MPDLTAITLHLAPADTAAIAAAAKAPSLTARQRARLARILQHAESTRRNDTPARTVVVDLSGGVVHELLASDPSLANARFIFLAEEDECDPDNLVKVSGDRAGRCIYSVHTPSPLTASLRNRAERAASEYNKAG